MHACHYTKNGLMEMTSGSHRFRVSEFYYIAPLSNMPSILRDGILSNNKVNELELDHESIANEDIVNERRSRIVSEGRTLTSYANLFFWPRNPMLYKHTDAARRNMDKTVIIGVKKSILNINGIVISAGNARSQRSQFYSSDRLDEALDIMGDAVGAEFWTKGDDEGKKRKSMAEFLVPDFVPPEYIDTIYVPNEVAKNSLIELLRREAPDGYDSIPIVVVPYLFFLPEWSSDLTKTISLVKGDMFFSQMQTLTISVNCKGVMGRGLASRAKYQFPDVYVRYQDLCKSHKLKLGKPYLYMREGDESLTNQETMNGINDDIWFLLFPTKDHWKNRADIKGIEKGLRWLVDEYDVEGIKSLALPALGCGYGWLSWESVGPLLCQYLQMLEIPIQLYLPAEKEIPEEQLTADFLLNSARKDTPF